MPAGKGKLVPSRDKRFFLKKSLWAKLFPSENRFENCLFGKRRDIAMKLG